RRSSRASPRSPEEPPREAERAAKPVEPPGWRARPRADRPPRRGAKSPRRPTPCCWQETDGGRNRGPERSSGGSVFFGFGQSTRNGPGKGGKNKAPAARFPQSSHPIQIQKAMRINPDCEGSREFRRFLGYLNIS